MHDDSPFANSDPVPVPVEHEHEWRRFVLLSQFISMEGWVTTKMFSETLTSKQNPAISYVGWQCVRCGEYGYAAC